MRKIFLGFTLGIAMLSLAGCTNSDVADDMYSGVPKGFQGDPFSAQTTATWIEENSRFAVITWGSSSCPPIARDLVVHSEDRLEIMFKESSQNPCTADMVPTTHEFSLPNGVTDRPVEITFSYDNWDETDTVTLE